MNKSRIRLFIKPDFFFFKVLSFFSHLQAHSGKPSSLITLTLNVSSLIIPGSLLSTLASKTSPITGIVLSCSRGDWKDKGLDGHWNDFIPLLLVVKSWLLIPKTRQWNHASVTQLAMQITQNYSHLFHFFSLHYCLRDIKEPLLLWIKEQLYIKPFTAKVLIL